jgi:branched-chain amino acid transport system ATP-binding protein
MLSVARTLLGKPRVLLLDEPLEGLAPVICDELMTSLQALAADGSMTILLVEQQIERALGFAQDVFILERGCLVWTGTAGQLRSSSTIVEKYLGAGIH